MRGKTKNLRLLISCVVVISMVVTFSLVGCKAAPEVVEVEEEAPAVVEEEEAEEEVVESDEEIVEVTEISGKIYILNWKGYGSDESWAWEMFNKKYPDVEIIHDYYSSNEELLTKLRTDPGTYDAVLIGNTWGTTAMEKGILEVIDPTFLSNYPDLSTNLKELPDMRKGDIVYGIPWCWGATAIAYNNEEIEEEITSMNVFWDPKYKGKIVWQDYFLDNVMFAAIALGQDPNDPSDLDAIKQKLVDLMPQLSTFWASEEEFNQLFAAGEFLLGTYWSGSTARAAGMGLPISFVVPEEGAIGWVDSWAIPKDAPNIDAAMMWINFMISPEFYLEWDAKVGAPVPSNEVTLAQLPESSLNKQILGDPEVQDRLIFYRALSEEVKQEWLEIWHEVKAYE